MGDYRIEVNLKHSDLIEYGSISLYHPIGDLKDVTYSFLDNTKDKIISIGGIHILDTMILGFYRFTMTLNQSEPTSSSNSYQLSSGDSLRIASSHNGDEDFFNITVDEGTQAVIMVNRTHEANSPYIRAYTSEETKQVGWIFLFRLIRL